MVGREKCLEEGIGGGCVFRERKGEMEERPAAKEDMPAELAALNWTSNSLCHP